MTALTDGGYVVTWQSRDQDGDGFGIYLQRYDASGDPVGPETRVNTTTAGDQNYPSVTALADGGYVVTWQSLAQDGDSWGIYLQRYDANGDPVGPETRVNTTTANQQEYPEVTALADGGYVVTWTSYGQDGEGLGIYQQRYDAAGQPVVAEQAIAENATGGMVVGTLSATDRTTGIVTYTLIDDAGGRFEIVGSQLRLKAGASLDYEDPSTHRVTIRVTDQGGLSYDQVLTVSVTDANEPPAAITVSANPVGEYALVGTVVAMLSSSDPEGDTISYQLVGDTAGLFRIDGNQVVLNGALNHEAARSHTITVQALDGKGGVSATSTFTIDVADEVTLNKRGSSRNDKLNGSNGDDILKGGSSKGKDTIKGLDGDDKLYGEGGDDKLYGGNGIDRLYGGKDNDQLRGEAGDDFLYGEDGNDVLYGGQGKDTFVFNTKLSKTKNYDQIKDFNVADDTIWLDNKIFKKLGKAGSEDAPAVLNAGFLVIGSMAKDKNDYIVYDNRKGVLYYDEDGSGRKKAIEVAKLAKNLKLTADDFFVI